MQTTSWAVRLLLSHEVEHELTTMQANGTCQVTTAAASTPARATTSRTRWASTPSRAAGPRSVSLRSPSLSSSTLTTDADVVPGPAPDPGRRRAGQDLQLQEGRLAQGHPLPQDEAGHRSRPRRGDAGRRVDDPRPFPPSSRGRSFPTTLSAFRSDPFDPLFTQFIAVAQRTLHTHPSPLPPCRHSANSSDRTESMSYAYISDPVSDPPHQRKNFMPTSLT